MNEFSQADELAPWQAPFRKSLHSFGWAQHHSKLQQNSGQGEIPELVWCLGPFRLWFIPKQLWQWEPCLAVTTSIAWHHLNLVFFFFLLVRSCFPRQSWELGWTLGTLQPLCSPQPCSWASAPFRTLVLHKNPEILPKEDLQVGTEVVLHCTKIFIANLIFPMRRKSNYPVRLKEVQIINF